MNQKLIYTAISFNLDQLFLVAVDKLKIDLYKMKFDGNNNCLMLAVIFSNLKVAKFLLKNYEDMLLEENDDNFYPIEIATYINDNLMFILLAKNSQNLINEKGLIAKLYKLAIRNENMEILNYLKTNFSNYELELQESKEILHYACCQTNLEVFEFILNTVKKSYIYYKIEPNNDSCLHWAAMKGSYSIVKRLVEIYKKDHQDIDVRNANKVTPFYLANLRQEKSICELLYNSGAYPNVLDCKGNSIVHVATAIGDVKWLKYIIKKFNASWLVKNNLGNTPFMLAVLNGHLDIVKYMISLFKLKDDCNNIINCKNNMGQTPLHAAVFVEDKNIIKVLLENNADITICDINDFSPYHYAYISKKVDIVNAIHSILKINDDV